MLRSAATYPEVMRQELLRLNPNARISVINSGRVGDTIPDNLARFERDVFAASWREEPSPLGEADILAFRITADAFLHQRLREIKLA